MFTKQLGLIVVSMAIVTGGLLMAANLTNPYEILNKYFVASGGLERLRAETTQYVEGTLSVAGLNGTLKAWTQKPGRSRAEIDLGVLKMTEGDNGEFQWTLDANGKLQKITKPDDASNKRRQLRKLTENYEYADPSSKVFKVTLTGTEKVQDKDCYVLKITNTINSDVQTYYIDAADYMLLRSTSSEGEESKDALFGDYRKVDGLTVAYWTKETQLLTGQTQEMKFSKYLSNLEVDTTSFNPPQEAAKDYQFANGNSAENIQFQFVGNHIFLPVTVACKERTWILDTGAGMSVISEKFAKELGLKLEGDMKGSGAGGTVNVKFTTLPSYSLHGIEFNGQTVAVIDMTDLNRAIGFDCAGILGFDFLSRFVTKIDYAAKLLSFYDPESFKYVGDGTEINMHLKGTVFQVDAKVDNADSGSWLFDVGASSTNFDAYHAKEMGYSNRNGVAGMGRGAGATYETKSLKFKNIELAGYTIDNPIINFPTGDGGSAVKSDAIGGLGNTLFQNFIIYCDYTHEKLIVEKGDRFNIPVPHDNSGLQLIVGTDGGTEVFFIAKDTPAAKAGFQVGDLVKSVNGVALERLSGINALREMLMEKPGTEYKIVVERQGQPKECRLTLQDLF